MARSLGRTGRRYLRARQQVLDASTVCWLCGHEGADTADHDPPLATLEALGLDPADPAHLRPAHGVNGCPTCHRKCNQSKGDSTYIPAPTTSRNW